MCVSLGPPMVVRLLLVTLLVTLRAPLILSLPSRWPSAPVDDDRQKRSIAQLTALRRSFEQLQTQLGTNTLMVDNEQPSFEYEITQNELDLVQQDESGAQSRHRLRHQNHRKDSWRRKKWGDERPDDWQRELTNSVRAGISTVPSDEEGDDSRLQSLSGYSSGFLRGPGLHKSKVCPKLHGKERIMCPSKNRGRYHVCINIDQLCNNRRDCPGGEDENSTNCLFYKTTMGHFKKVVDAVVALTDHMVKSEQRGHHEL